MCTKLAAAIVLLVDINGEGPFRFFIDTGAASSVVEPKLAKRLRLEPRYQVSLLTPAGGRNVPAAEARSMTAGGVAASHVEVLSYPLNLGGGGILRGVEGVEGVLGHNFLSHFNYLLDYNACRVRFESGDDISRVISGRRLPLRRGEDRDTIQAGGLDFLLDSGASDLVFFKKPKRALPPEVALSGSGRISTHTGTRDVLTARLRQLRLGDAVLEDLPAAIVEDRDGRPEDALLPTRLFRAVYVNNREGYVIVNPQFLRPPPR